MKRIVLSCLILVTRFGFSQAPEVQTVSANLIAKTKRIEVKVNDRIDVFYKDTAYTLAIALKVANLGETDKLVLKIGTLQNDSIGGKRQYTIKIDPNNSQQRIGEDVEPFVQIGQIVDGMLMVFFDLPEADFVKVKKVTAFVKSNGITSQKRFYDFE